MPMSRKHYVLVASTLQQMREAIVLHTPPEMMEEVDRHIRKLAIELKNDNPSFDSYKFLVASGVNPSD